MIELDRSKSVPVTEQLVEQLRFQIATGRFQIGERLPSTRKFGDQLDVSFHTVRKAYQALETEGMVTSRPGGGFFVAEPPRISTSERMEKGAAIVEDAVKRLLALGFSREEIEYQVDETIHYSHEPGPRRKIVYADAFQERSESIADILSSLLQENVESSTVLNLNRHVDADAVITPLPHMQLAMESVPQAEVFGAMLAAPYDILEAIAHLGSSDAIGLVTKYKDAVQVLGEEIRLQTGFAGQVIAIPSDGEARRTHVVLRQVDFVVYTQQVRRRIRPLLGDHPSAELRFDLTQDAMQHIRSIVGR